MFKIIIITVSLLIFTSVSALNCKDANNKSVEWYYIYKLPRQAGHNNVLIQNGEAFIYLTSKDATKWKLSTIGIKNSSSMIGMSLSPLYNSSYKENMEQEILYILYNDQPPNKTASSTKGHTKGVVLTDKISGLWLIHSVPNFPFGIDQYKYPESGLHNGQSFLCLSLDLKNLNNIGIQLQYNEPFNFALNLPNNTTFTNLVPELVKAAENNTIKNNPFYRVTNITTTLNGSTIFQSFAKSRKFDKDLYSDLVSEFLHSDLYVETWPNEPNRFPSSNCNKTYQVDNIKSILISDLNMQFETTVDHSKWAVSASTDKIRYICIGDINRAKSQTRRGGGTTCLKNTEIANQYLNIIGSIESCCKTNNV